MTSLSVARRVVRTTAALGVALLVLADVPIAAESRVPEDTPCAAVASYARMDPQWFGLPPDAPLLASRLQRVVTRELSGPFGVRTSRSYGTFLIGDAASATVTLEFENGWRASYRRMTAGTGEQDTTFVHDDKPSRFVNSRLFWKHDGWQLELTDGTSYRFSTCAQTSPRRCAMSAYTDRDGHETLVRFDARGDIAKIEGEHHHTLEFQHDARHHIVLAWDDAGGWMTYEYDGGGRLTKSLSSFEEESGYAYDADGRLIGVRVGALEERIHYDAHGRCSRLERRRLDYVDAAGHPFEHRDVFDFTYTLDESGPRVQQTIVTGVDGTKS